MIVLHVDASPKQDSESRKLGESFLTTLGEATNSLTVTSRSLAKTPPDLVTEPFIWAMYTPAGERSPEQRKLMVASDALVDELLKADILLITTPMHNFGVPAALKAWIDAVTIKDRTFEVPADRSSTANYKGLTPPKPVVIASSVGGSGYGPGEPNAGFNALDAQLDAALRFIGLSDIRAVRAEYASMNDERRKASVARAETQLRDMAHALAKSVTERSREGAWA